MQGAPLALVLTLSLSTLALMTAAMTGGGEPAPPVSSPRPASASGHAAIHTGAAQPGPARAVTGGTVLRQAGEQELALADDGRLIADQALRAVMDAYLSQRDDDRRMQSLDHYLSAALPAGAAQEARRLAAQYDTYLGRHAALLHAQQFTDDPDLYRLDSWIRQRRQLREQLLGAAVTEQWFGTEDAYLQQALDERRLAGDSGATTPASEDERRHAAHMRQAIAAATGRDTDGEAR
jgi:hypothetical protein